MLTLQADLVGGAYEQTKYIYGVSTAGGDSINSNDVLKEVDWPDKSTGNASSSEKETYTVNGLGQLRTYTDRNGNVHGLTYDVLGRNTSDTITTLGSGVDGSEFPQRHEVDNEHDDERFGSHDQNPAETPDQLGYFLGSSVVLALAEYFGLPGLRRLGIKMTDLQFGH